MTSGLVPLLAADCVAKSWRGRGVLTSGSLRALPGQFRVLLGRNGAGKSTLIEIAVGLVSPDGGTIFFHGEALPHASLSAMAARGLCYWPDAGLLSSTFTVGRQLEFFASRFAGGDPESAAERAGVGALLGRRPSSLSGGERRRADLAAILVRRPTCLVADEPYRGVAPKDAELLTEALRELAAGGAAVMVAGHEVPTLFAAADHVTWCAEGTTYELGRPSEAARHERFRRMYLGPTYAGVLARMEIAP